MDEASTSNIVLVGATSSTLTISWPKIIQNESNDGSMKYILQYLAEGLPLRDDIVAGDDGYATLSQTLTANLLLKKKNLRKEDGPYRFRVRDAPGINDWIGHELPFNVLSNEEESILQMSVPNVNADDVTCSVHLEWNEIDVTPKMCDFFEIQNDDLTIKGYEIQMRICSIGGSPWETIAPCFSGLQVRKKNLDRKSTYHFRLRPVFENASLLDRYESPFSMPSDVVVFHEHTISPGLLRLFNGIDQLLVNGGRSSAKVENSLGGPKGKVILLYASAHWCGPCRQFTPQLVQFYNRHHRKDLEIVFLSADHDEASFRSYYNTMPWNAIPYDSDVRQRLLSWIKVTGIPRLVVLNSNTGGILIDNVVGKPMDVKAWREQM